VIRSLDSCDHLWYKFLKYIIRIYILYLRNFEFDISLDIFVFFRKMLSWYFLKDCIVLSSLWVLLLALLIYLPSFSVNIAHIISSGVWNTSIFMGQSEYSLQKFAYCSLDHAALPFSHITSSFVSNFNEHKWLSVWICSEGKKV